MTAADTQPAQDLHDGSATAQHPRARDSDPAGHRRRFTFDWTVRSRRVLAIALVASVISGAVFITTHYGTPVGDLLRYAGYVAGWVLVPGFILQRVLIGARGSWAEEALVSLATGVVATLPFWMLASFLHAQSMLILWPIAALALLIVPRARRRVLSRPTGHWHPLAQAATAGSMLIALAHLGRSYFAAWPLPPSGRTYYQDLLWHMGLAAEATRSFPLQVPQAITAGMLRYQWFADADVASVSLISGLSIPTLFLRLWPILMVVLAIGLTAVLGAVLSRHSTVGGLGALAATATTILSPWRSQIDLSDPYRPISPTQLYAFTPLLLALIVLVILVRRDASRTGAAILGLLSAIVAAGAKPSVMPLLLVGLATGTVAAIVLRAPWKRLAWAAAAAAAITFGGMALVAGGDAGLRPKLFHALTFSPFVAQRITDGVFGGSGWIIPGMFSGISISLAVVFAAVLISLRPLLGIAPLLNATLRRDPLAWALSGMCGAGVAAALIVGHPGYSELYFLFTATPLGAVMGAWWFRVCIHTQRDRWMAIVSLLAGTALGIASAIIATRLSSSSTQTFVWTLAIAAIVLVGGLIIAFIVSVARNRRSTRRTAYALPVLGAVFGLLIASLAPTVSSATADQASSVAAQDESLAAVWLDAHAGRNDLVAVNDQCLDAENSTCDAREWWVSGLGGRRVLLEGWSYTPQSSALEPTSTVRPVFDLGLWRFNQLLFTSPTKSDLDRAKALGVRYLVATTSATETSPRLAELAPVVFENPTVTIYRIP